jgi:NAD(P)-dependent dehydrogenase (short-subunit alcohol dehydrogenase family)
MGRSCEGLVALVTGASQGGTGRSVAIRFAAEGAKVAITARSEDGLAETLARIEEVGGTGLVLPADLGDPAGGRATLVERTEAAFGPIDILVNNAVAHALKPVHEWTIEELEAYAQVNLWSPWLHTSQVLPGMRERGRGWILNLTSFSGELPPGPPFAFKAKDGSAMYGATKAALNRLTVAAAGENEGLGVAVNALTPQCAISTPRVQAGGLVSGAELFEPVETMAEAALVLCTGDPSTLTGRIAFSLQLLLELERPVYDLHGKELVDGWQPADLVRVVRAQEEFHAGNGWPHAFDFHRVHTPRPAALDAESELLTE